MPVFPTLPSALLFLVTGLLMAPAAVEAEAREVVRYDDFGARGDGKTDDFEALAKAHAHANRHGLPVEADPEATYYIGGADRTIAIETDTDFGSARFIIDDTRLENIRANVFEVRSNRAPLEMPEVRALKRGQRRIAARLPQACLVIVTNDKVKRFIRRGLNPTKGKGQTDVFVVDPDGRVDPRTPIIWDFDEITGITARPIDEDTLRISGGTFTTIANQAESAYDYHARGISIRRSRVLVEGLTHLVRGEGKTGAPYSGFIRISRCAHVMVRDCRLTGHKTYRTIGRAGKPVSMGSYDLSVSQAAHVSFVRCTQTNDIMDPTYWGIIGTNFCKMLEYDGCKLSRFDAHMGVTHAAIRNSTLGYMGIRLTGSGTFLVEDTTVQARHFIHLREDYGSTWRGKGIIRNCRFLPRLSRRAGPSIVGGFNDGQHDFGYTCHLPQRLVIDGLHIADGEPSSERGGPAIFANFNPDMTDESYHQEYPYQLPREVVVREVTTESGKPLRLSHHPFMFRGVEVDGLVEE